MGVILLDPGHGMSNRHLGVFDSGALGQGGEKEADLTLEYCEAIKAALSGSGHSVFMTRTDNTQDCSLLDRIRKHATVGANVMLSIHFNASENKGPEDGKVKGFQVCWRTVGSDALARNFFAALTAASRHAFNGGISQRPDLAVICKASSCLLEVGFVDDEDDLKLIKDPEWKDETCKVVARVLVDRLEGR